MTKLKRLVIGHIMTLATHHAEYFKIFPKLKKNKRHENERKNNDRKTDSTFNITLIYQFTFYKDNVML